MILEIRKLLFFQKTRKTPLLYLLHYHPSPLSFNLPEEDGDWGLRVGPNGFESDEKRVVVIMDDLLVFWSCFFSFWGEGVMQENRSTGFMFEPHSINDMP